MVSNVLMTKIITVAASLVDKEIKTRTKHVISLANGVTGRRSVAGEFGLLQLGHIGR
jgi:hypothetical protein